MPTKIFISHPSPQNKKQTRFLELLNECLEGYDLQPVNLGRRNFNYKSPLKPIKELIRNSKAAIIVGLERHHSLIGYYGEGSEKKKETLHHYTSSPWIQIESGMAYQQGLPLLIIKETKLLKEGILDSLTSEFFIYEFEIEEAQHEIPDSLRQIIISWIEDFSDPSM